MLLNWALMHNLEHCQYLDTSNWKYAEVLNSDTISGSATQKQQAQEKEANMLILFLDPANAVQRAAQNFDLTHRGQYCVCKFYSNRVIFTNNGCKLSSLIQEQILSHKNQVINLFVHTELYCVLRDFKVLISLPVEGPKQSKTTENISKTYRIGLQVPHSGKKTSSCHITKKIPQNWTEVK